MLIYNPHPTSDDLHSDKNVYNIRNNTEGMTGKGCLTTDSLQHVMRYRCFTGRREREGAREGGR